MKEWQINLFAALGGLGFAVLMLAATFGVASWVAAAGRSAAWLGAPFLGLPLLWIAVLAGLETKPRRGRGGGPAAGDFLKEAGG